MSYVLKVLARAYDKTFMAVDFTRDYTEERLQELKKEIQYVEGGIKQLEEQRKELVLAAKKLGESDLAKNYKDILGRKQQ